jgi:hypothetical protein
MYSIIIPIKIYEDNSTIYTNGFKLFKNIGIKSYKKFLGIENLEQIYLICPRIEMKVLEELVNEYKQYPYKILPDEDFISNNTITQLGWYKQQIIKLSISEIIKTKYYLVLDSDMYLNQSFKYDDLFFEEKIKYSSEPWQTKNNEKYSTNSNWWIGSCNVLNYDLEKIKVDDLMGVTPQLLITDVVKSLITNIKSINNDWQLYLCNNKFTEFTLYWIYILLKEYKDLYTNKGYPLWKHDLNTNILTYNCDRQKVKNSFVNSISFFSVIQGYIKQDLNPLIEEFNRQIGKHYDAIFITASMLIPNRFQSFQIHERLQQTTDTLNSIKQRIPNSFCVLIEGSKISDYVRYEYNRHYDYVIELGNDQTILPYVNHPHNIGHGEMKLLEHGINYVLTNILNKSTTDYIFKLGARYTLNNSFVIGNYSKDKYTFRAHYDESVNCNVFTTGLYSIPVSKVEEFKRILIEGQNILTSKCSMIEKLFVDMIPNEKIYLIHTLGLEGMLSYNKHFFSV